MVQTAVALYTRFGVHKRTSTSGQYVRLQCPWEWRDGLPVQHRRVQSHGELRFVIGDDQAYLRLHVAGENTSGTESLGLGLTTGVKSGVIALGQVNRCIARSVADSRKTGKHRLYSERPVSDICRLGFSQDVVALPPFVWRNWGGKSRDPPPKSKS